jgi:hypothetical protein
VVNFQRYMVLQLAIFVSFTELIAERCRALCFLLLLSICYSIVMSKLDFFHTGCCLAVSKLFKLKTNKDILKMFVLILLQCIMQCWRFRVEWAIAEVGKIYCVQIMSSFITTPPVQKFFFIHVLFMRPSNSETSVSGNFNHDVTCKLNRTAQTIPHVQCQYVLWGFIPTLFPYFYSSPHAYS